MSLRLGRISPLPEPTHWDAGADDAVSITGSYRSTGLSDGMVKRDQLLALDNNKDEPVIPVVLDGDPRETGYYRVASVSVPTDEFTRLKGNLYDYRVELVRARSFAQPLLESILNGGLQSNGVGAADTDSMAFHAVPSGTEYQSPLAMPSLTQRVSASGPLDFTYQAGSVGFGGTGKYAARPADFYIGASTFEQGTPLQVVVGRNFVQPDVTNWRLHNDLLRVTPSATPGRLDLSRFNGSTWSAVKTFALKVWAGGGGGGGDRATETMTTAGTINGSIFGSISTFKAASGSSIARVGALGALATGSPVTPAYGQATVATHLLVAWVQSTGTGTGTTAAGWVLDFLSSINSSGQVQVWYKPNCGAGEAAPTFTTTGGVITAQLGEFSGVDTVAPLEGHGTLVGAGGANSTSASASADANVGNLIIFATLVNLTGAATATFAEAFNNGATAVHAGDDGATSQNHHSSNSYGITTASAVTAFNSLTVLRNSVEETIIRLSLATAAGSAAGLFTLDLRLRRGDYLLRMFASTTGPATHWTLARETTEAASVIGGAPISTGGIKAAAADGTGNRYVILSYELGAPTTDLVNGSMTTGPASKNAYFGVGLAVDSALAPDDPISLARQFLAAQYELQRVVAR